MDPSVQASLIAAVAAILASGISAYALIQSRQTHKLINSRMDEMLRLTQIASRAEGVAAGEQAQRDRDMTPRSE